MNFLVTGGAGFIGSAVCRHLCANPAYRVTNLDKLTYAGNLASLRPIENAHNYRFAQADICDERAVLDILRRDDIDIVMNLAAESHVDRSIDGPGTFIETNIVGTYKMLNAALEYWRGLPEDRKSHFRFHHVSTDEVFGDLPFDGGMFVEETPYAPSSPYSASKAASDHLVRAWHETYGLPVVLSNCSNNYGPYHFPEKLIPLVILNALDEKPLPVYGAGANVRDWLFVEDHARALELVATRGLPGESYNVGGNSERTNLGVVETICDLLDSRRPRAGGKSYRDLISFVTDRPGHDRRYAIDASKIGRDLGWTPNENFDSGLAKTVDWFLDNKWWWGPIREQRYAGERLGEARKGGGVRLVVTGRDGQVAASLLEAGQAAAGVEVIAIGRPQLDLARPDTVIEAIAAAKPDIVVSAAAYTAVDQAEDEPDLAFAVNAVGAGKVAQAAAELGVPIIHLSTDYVFDGTAPGAYVETDATAPRSVYGASKLAGEQAVASANPRHLILRTAWVYSPFGKNFVKTMLRLAADRDEIAVVADQWGNPTSALDIADAILHAAAQLHEGAATSGIYHLAGTGEANWSGFARHILDTSRVLGGPWARVRDIATMDYPTKARRPANSRLSSAKFTDVFGWRAPDWRQSTEAVVHRLLDGETKQALTA